MPVDILSRRIDALAVKQADLAEHVDQLAKIRTEIEKRADASECLRVVEELSASADPRDLLRIGLLVAKHGPTRASKMEHQRRNDEEEIVAAQTAPELQDRWLAGLIRFYQATAATPDAHDLRTPAEKQQQKRWAKRILERAVSGDFEEQVRTVLSALSASILAAAATETGHREARLSAATGLAGVNGDDLFLDKELAYSDAYDAAAVWSNLPASESGHGIPKVSPRKAALKALQPHLRPHEDDPDALEKEFRRRSRKR